MYSFSTTGQAQQRHIGGKSKSFYRIKQIRHVIFLLKKAKTPFLPYIITAKSTYRAALTTVKAYTLNIIRAEIKKKRNAKQVSELMFYPFIIRILTSVVSTVARNYETSDSPYILFSINDGFVKGYLWSAQSLPFTFLKVTFQRPKGNLSFCYFSTLPN